MAADDEHEADRRQIQVFISSVAAMLTEAARDRAERQRHLAGDLREQARLLEAQYATERAAAHALWAPAMTEDWWARASIADVRAAYRAAAEWEQVDNGASMVADRIRERVNQQRDVGRRGERCLSTAEETVEAVADQRNTATGTREHREAPAATVTAAATSSGAPADAVEEAVAAHMLVHQCAGVDGPPTSRANPPSRSTSRARRNAQQQERRRQLHR